jgi:tRNA pseudouridine55 synthase
VKRDPRFVHVFSYRIDGIELPVVEFTVKCSKGFYVRTYCHDIGQDLGCGAHMKSLRRTRSGKFDLERAVTFEELKFGDREDIISKMMTLPEVSRLRGA